MTRRVRLGLIPFHRNGHWIGRGTINRELELIECIFVGGGGSDDEVPLELNVRHSVAERWKWRKVDLIKLLDVLDCPRMGLFDLSVVQWQRFQSMKCVTE